MRRVARSTALCYHAVSATWHDPLAVTAESFEAQIRSLLRRRFRPVSGQEILRGEPATFHVTFDDCYASIKSVLALLLELDVPATLFVCPPLADDGASIVLPELDGRADGHEHELLTMTWDELRTFVEAGCEVGSHTLTHPHLTLLPDAELRDELVLSRERIEDELGRPCRLLAYPYGESDPRVRAAACEAGYAAAFGLAERRSRANAFAFPRADIYRGTDAIRFRAKTGRNGGAPLLFQAMRHMRARWELGVLPPEVIDAAADWWVAAELAAW